MIFLNSYIDATVLGPAVNTDAVTALAEDTETYSYAAVCIPPYFVKEIRTSYADIKIATVIGFPQGIQSIAAKKQEIEDAINSGADELDIVVNLTAIANDDLSYLELEIEELLKVKQDKVYKLILESASWTDTVLENVVKFYSQYPVEFLKTSTGFNGDGASVNAVQIMLDNKNENQEIKASGGIRDYETAAKYIEMGVKRIGTSSAKKLIEVS